MNRMLADRRGSVITLFAFSSMIMAVLVALVMNQISFYMAKRDLQAAVDMTTLRMMESGKTTVAAAKAMLEEQLGETVSEVKVVQGNYLPDAKVAEAGRFKANVSPYNAIQVTAKVGADKVMMGGMLSDNTIIEASARAARRTSATVVIGSRLVRIEGGLSAALLDATLGYKGKLTLMDYQSLVSAKVDAATYLRALNTQADIKAVTFDDVLNAPVSIGHVMNAALATTDDGKVKTLLAAGKPAAGAEKVLLNKVIDLGSMTKLPIDTLLSGESVPLSVGEVLTGAVALADKDHQISLDLASVLGNPAVANASLDLGEKPQIFDFANRALKGDELKTSQFRLDVGALGLTALTTVKVDVELASAEVEIDEIKCKADGTAEVTLKAKTEAASVGVKASLLPRIAVKLGNNESKKVSFNQAEIKAQTYKPVRSGLGLELNGLSVAQKLLFNPVDKLLEDLGLHVAEADVKVVAVSCGSAGLVH